MLETRLLTSVVLAFLAVVPAAAQEEEWEAVHREAPKHLAASAATPNCGGGLVYDDGSYETVYSLGPGNAGAVMRFDLPGGTTGLDQVCACFSRDSGAPSSMNFQVVVYDNNGTGGGPGTLLGTVSATATGIPVFPTAQYYNVNLASSGIALPDQNVFVGVIWPGGSPDTIFICGDRSPGTTQRTSFGSGNGGASWTNMTTAFPASPPRAMGIRVDPGTATAACVPSATAMCLNNNRFRVTATFRTAGQPAAAAQVFKLTEDTGYLYFFASTNVEVVVKVLNGCGLNNRYWVFAAGLTNVEVNLTVTDTLHPGVSKTYINPLNQPFPPLQDTSAFATCP